MPDDLTKLRNIVKNDVVKKTDYNTKISNIKTLITAVNKNALDNLVDTLTVDTSNFVTRAKISADTNALDDKNDKVDEKIPDVSGLATNSSLTAVENKIPDITSLITKTDFDAKLKDISDRVTNNESKDFLLDNETKKLKMLVGSTAGTNSDEGEKEDSFTRGFYYYIQQSYLVYECKVHSFNFSNGEVSEWKSTGIFNYSNDSSMKGIKDSKTKPAEIENDGRMQISLFRNYFEQNELIIPNINNVINIYCVYQLDPISSSRDTTYTIQNALFGAVQITKNADTSKYAYKRYGICFDEGGIFSEGFISNGRNVLIFGVHESSLVHSNDKANNIYVMGKDFVQGINDATLYADKVYSQNFTQPSKKFVLSLHYNGNNSYLFVNGRQELKFKCKKDQLVKEKLCIGNLSDQWTTSESEKTGL